MLDGGMPTGGMIDGGMPDGGKPDGFSTFGRALCKGTMDGNCTIRSTHQKMKTIQSVHELL